MPKLGTTARGYGSLHQDLRKRLSGAVATGEVKCWRCGEPISPSDHWDLGHDDHDRSIYRGPEHRRCNRSTNRKRLYSRRW